MSVAGIVGQVLLGFVWGDANPNISSDLNAYSPADYTAAVYDSPENWFLGGGYSSFRGATSTGWGIQGRPLYSFSDDFYNRIWVTPKVLDLGSLAGEQVRTIEVWNAWLVAQTLTDTPLANGEGIEVTPPAPLPVVFEPLQQRIWEVRITTNGPATVDAALTFQFTGLDDITVQIIGSRMLPWPLLPDWTRGIDESLAWRTDEQTALDGSRDTEPKLESPRRRWEFDLLEGRHERRIIENMLYDWTARVWALPVWTDQEFLSATLPAGASEILLDTAGLDFTIGGQALLWSDVRRYELVEIAGILADRLVLARPTLTAWVAGTRLYPCRQSRLQQAPNIVRKSDQVIVSGRVQFEADEPCDWPAIPPAVTYLGIPVLDRGDETEDPQASFPRQVTVLDGDVGLVDVADITNLAWQSQSHAWRLYGRSERAAHRSALYWLAGRAGALWVPSFADDLELVEDTGALGDSMVVAWCGVSAYLRQQAGRRHVRIELNDGRVFFRRVAASDELDVDRERVNFDTGLGEVITPPQVRQISWMALSALASDAVDIHHEGDSHGMADCRVSFTATPAEEPAWACSAVEWRSTTSTEGRGTGA